MTTPIPRPVPEDFVSPANPDHGSEFGGVPGLIAPPPHELTELGSPASERAMYMRSIPADEMIVIGDDGRGHEIRGFGSTYEAPPTTLVRP